jgi:hypothetical protein
MARLQLATVLGAEIVFHETPTSLPTDATTAEGSDISAAEEPEKNTEEAPEKRRARYVRETIVLIVLSLTRY